MATTTGKPRSGKRPDAASTGKAKLRKGAGKQAKPEAEIRVSEAKGEAPVPETAKMPESAKSIPEMLAGPFLNAMDGPMRSMLATQSGAAMAMFDALLGGNAQASEETEREDVDGGQWDDIARRLKAMWSDFATEQPDKAGAGFADPKLWLNLASKWSGQWPLAGEEHSRMMVDGMALWENMLGQYGLAAPSDENRQLSARPREDRRFADSKWQDTPIFALLHQAYLLMSEQMMAAVEKTQGLTEERKAQLRFYTRITTEALSPAHFPLTNPLVIDRMVETNGESLVRGIEHLIADLRAGQLTHTDTSAFELGRDIAATPGKVVYETDLFQLIQYTPATENVLDVPLVIFPPWINRFYILDLSTKKSFVRWAVEHGLTVFMVSWKSADASMAEVGWEDYIGAMIQTIDVVRARLKVPAVHTIGYCVGGTTLAGALAVLARRGEADKVKSATFFTAQVDFSEAGELKSFIDEQHLATIDSLGTTGYIDGRYLAATFNLLRSPDLIWNYVIRNYLMGEDYQPFDLLYWNSDSTNLPARFHREYLKQLYHDNRMVIPDSLTIDGTKLDLRRVQTPSYIQAGREDHIAPPESVWKMTHHFAGPVRFMLAGSGHIAGVVNPPESGKYQYWTLDEPDGPSRPLPDTLEEFVASAKETPGSWWGDWLTWIKTHDAASVPASGKRAPGSKGDKIIEDAPGRYVKMR